MVNHNRGRISIHAPLTGCDGRLATPLFTALNFNPRTPYGMRLEKESADTRTSLISIHAPLTGCDHFNSACVFVIIYFNPRTPYGMRPFSSYSLWLCTKFQSTHPLRDATLKCLHRLPHNKISIHAPLTGCDYLNQTLILLNGDFNPRTPYGMRL